MAKREYPITQRAEILGYYLSGDDVTLMIIGNKYGGGAQIGLPSWKKEEPVISQLAEDLGESPEYVRNLIQDKADGIRKRRRGFSLES